MNNLNMLKPIRPAQQRSVRTWFISSVGAIAIVGMTIAAVHFYYANTLARLKEKKYALEQKINRLEPSVQEKKKLLQQEQKGRLQLQKRMYITSMQENPGTYLQELARLIPAHAVVGNFTREAKKQIIIQGSAKNAHAVTQFLENLNRSKHFESMKLKHIKPSNTDDQLLRFMMHGKLVIPPPTSERTMPAPPMRHAHSII